MEDPLNGSLHEIFEVLREHELHNVHLYKIDSNQRILFGLVLPVVVAVSLLANGFICAVLTYTNAKDSSLAFDRLLQCLSCYDICVALTSLWVYTAPIWMEGTLYSKETHPTLLPYLLPVLHMAITGSDYLNLAATVERCLATDRHFRDSKSYHQGCEPSRSMVFILIIFIFTVTFNIPAFWELETIVNDDFQPALFENLTVGKLDVGEGETVYEVVTTSLRHNEIYNKMYRLMAEFLIFKATPWISFMILFLTMKNRIGFYKKRKVLRTLTLRQFYELQDTRIVLGITILFYVTNILPLYISFSHILLSNIEPIVVYLAKVAQMQVLNREFCVMFQTSMTSNNEKYRQSNQCASEETPSKIKGHAPIPQET